MNKEVLEFVTQKTRDLMGAASCCAEAKAAAQAWLDAVGTEGEGEQTRKYLAELEADIMPIDGLIAFAGSEAAKGYFGPEMAANVLAHAKEIKAAGAAYCDCPACAACAAILGKKDMMI